MTDDGKTCSGCEYIRIRDPTMKREGCKYCRECRRNPNLVNGDFYTPREKKPINTKKKM